MSAQLMELVRELKSLNARKKRGEPLTDDEDKRRRELKAYLKTALEQSKTGGVSTQEGTAVTSAFGSSASAASAEPPLPDEATLMTAPVAVETPAPRPVSMDAPAPQPYVPKKNAFAIDAGDLLAEAASSEVVDRSAPATAPRAVGGAGPSFEPTRASRADIEEMEARAERAARANEARRTTDPSEIAGILGGSLHDNLGYTAPEENFYLEQYYFGYADEGYAFVEEPDAVDLAPVDPRELELYRAGLLGGGGEKNGVEAQVPAGLAFLDDFPALYQRGVLPSPDEEVEPDSEDPNLLVPGKRKVTVHLLNGTVKRGAIRHLRRGDLGFRLEPVGPGRVEELSFTQVKAVFIHTGRGPHPTVQGRTLTVMFKDRRSVQGVSDDYQPGAAAFSLVPPPGRGQFERIIVNAAAVASVR